jgi:hypothetical protein
MSSGETHRFQYAEAQNDHALTVVRSRLDVAIAATGHRMKLHPASRVVQWARLLAELARADRRAVISALVASLQGTDWDHPYRSHFRALVESRSFIEIVEHLLPDLAAADLRDLVSGTLDPAAERSDSRARDREFELFVATVCRRAALEVRLAEPDVLCTTPRGVRALAAKRLSSRRRVHENVSKATDQISRAGKPGFIFLDVTRLIEPRYEFMMHWKRGDGFLAGKLLAFERSEFRAVFARSRGEFVRGIVLRVVFPLLSEGLRLGTSETWHAVGVPGDDGIELNAFLHDFFRGLDGV